MPRFTVRVYRLNSPGVPAQDYAVDYLCAVGEPLLPIDGPALVYNPSAVAVMLVTPTGEQPVVAAAAPASLKVTTSTDAK